MSILKYFEFIYPFKIPTFNNNNNNKEDSKRHEQIRIKEEIALVDPSQKNMT